MPSGWSKNFVGAKLGRNLFLVDIVCHGVVSPNIWRDYISYLESQRQKKIVSFNFRDKITFGWSAHRETYKYEGKDETMVSNYHCTTKFILENLAHHVIFAIPSEWEMSLWLISGDGKNKE